MKRKAVFSVVVSLACALAITASPLGGRLAYAADKLTGQGDGFGGPVEVTLTVEDGKITDVKIVGSKETKGIGTLAMDALPDAIIEANGADVDVVATATVTSDAIIYAVNNALDPEAYPYPIESEAPAAPEAVVSASVYQGFGISNSGRIGPGVDNEEVQIYSINNVLAHVLFDEDGKILAIQMDQIETATSNSSSADVPHFSGFPGGGGYGVDINHDGVVDGKVELNDSGFQMSLENWATKRERGDAYRMNSGTWVTEMDAFQELFVGMTVEEVEEWYTNYCSDVNGRPLKPGSTNEDDAAKYDALTDEEKEMLADVVASATMSLNDGHGNIIAAIVNAYENRVPLDIEGAVGMGVGTSSSGRVGPGKDAEDVQIYSVNQVFANTLFDEDGRIVAIYVDHLEYATPNYDGDGMPHFSGFPGQLPYNYDENHDGTISGVIEPTEETFMEEIASWATKRERGDSYRMGSGTWSSEMDKFQEVFVGMTVDEAEEWFAKYCSDVNGRPLKADSTSDEDKAKYEALSEEEQEMLADVVASATMSLNDSHGDIMHAIRKSFENAAVIDLQVK